MDSEKAINNNTDPETKNMGQTDSQISTSSINNSDGLLNENSHAESDTINKQNNGEKSDEDDGASQDNEVSSSVADQEDDDLSSDFSLSNENEARRRAKAKDRSRGIGTLGHSSTVSTMSLLSPFAVKSSPADPFTTKEDANSVMSKDTTSNNLPKDTTNENMTKLHENSTIDQATSYKEDAGEMTSLKAPASPDSSTKVLPNGSSLLDAFQYSKYASSSPKLPYFSRNGNGMSTQNAKDTKPKNSFDTRLYVDEKLKGTEYRYAINKRNKDFHDLFPSLNELDRLLDDFSCALSREILLQGKIYVSENHICFNSNLLGWVTTLIIPLSEVKSIERKSTAGLFPNGIMIVTKDSKHNFASFLSRDATFEFINAVWKCYLREHRAIGMAQGDTNDSSVLENVSTTNIESPEKFESYILSIDGDDDRTSDDDSNDSQSNSSTDNHLYKDQRNTVLTKVIKLRDDSTYSNQGPDYHMPTTVPSEYFADNEIELCDEVIEAPIGIVFDILFGSVNTSFQLKFLESHDASEVSELGKFEELKEDSSKLERSFTYRRTLGYSIGPKFTKCDVKETIEHFDMEDFVVVETSTVTPDVPLGNSFSVRTRYYLSWHSNNFTRLRLAFYILWTGSSWIKSVIEKLALTGQREATSDLLVALKKEVKTNTYESNGPKLTISQLVGDKMIEEKESKSASISEQLSTSDGSAWYAKIKNSPFIFIYLLLFTIVILQVVIIAGLNNSNEITRRKFVISSNLLVALESLRSGNYLNKIRNKGYDQNTSIYNEEIWDVLCEKLGKKLNFYDKVDFISRQLQDLSIEALSEKNDRHDFWGLAEDKVSELKKLFQEFNYRDISNADGMRRLVGDLL